MKPFGYDMLEFLGLLLLVVCLALYNSWKEDE